jgi:glycolate oxidase FAD binding subunit
MTSSAAMTLEQGATHLAAIIGAEHAIVRGETVVAVPANVRQVAEVMRFANANGLTVMPTGSGSKLGWGNPVAPDIVLNMNRICQLREHAWQDMTCTVEAGCPWTAMQAKLGEYGQMVALDPLWPDRATIGGIVATNDSGALRLRYGGLRDLIIGMTVVLADGTVAKSGGKVVKNVAGYDIHKLMTGSFGTLGVIVEVNFRLHPVEEHSRTWTAVAPNGATDPKLFVEPLRALMDSLMVPSSLQLRISKRESALDVRIAGPEECLEEYGTSLQMILGGLPIVGQSQADAWNARQQVFDNKHALLLKIAALSAEICSISAELHQWSFGDGRDVKVLAQANGLMTVAIEAPLESVPMLIEILRTRVQEFYGSLVVLQLPDALRGRVDVWGPNRAGGALMNEIKRRFDPGRILNPGRFVENI